ncbi:MAG: thymidine phosphorylase [Polyangiaceae bacterium]|nr:thymidine phosphorylase [Polyangiaceae bacterium]
MARNAKDSAVSDAVTATDWVAAKRDGREHTPKEIAGLLGAFLRGDVTDYQMSAWLMAVYLQGMTDRETVALTEAMRDSGRVLSLDSVPGFKVDKHSTGGVGDKVSICLAPLVAACGVSVPMVAGRGLGHTGGTLDKLEAIPGYRTALSLRKFESVVRRHGLSIIGQTAEMAPADRRLYALRDVTGTVASVPLIVASILSKKLAEGSDGLVMDVKVGRGAFMKDLPQARELAKALSRVGRGAGKSVVSLVTQMDVPLGYAIGNALEIQEAIQVLLGEGPPDTTELTLRLGAEMLVMAGISRNRSAAEGKLKRAITDRDGLARLMAMVKAHGGEARVIEEPDRLPSAPHRATVRAKSAGYVVDVDPMALAQLAMQLGAGRQRTDAPIDPAVGIELVKKPGDRVQVGDTLAVLHLPSSTRKKHWITAALQSFTLRRRPVAVPPLVLERLKG